jgi:hypothetical protein
MTKKEHIAQHIKWHEAINELIKDFVLHTNQSPRETSLLTLLEWSYCQTKNPLEPFSLKELN